jgi:DNA polymerase-4
MSAAKVLARFATRVEGEIGITVSIGLPPTSFAKIASDLDKPRGFAVLGQAEARPSSTSRCRSSTASARSRRSASPRTASD